ncbi:hypothetical protein B0H13DRAFT_597571 [Mycena leptocephala]|nr:hypothetical protein B0H13DRAFT_597571 [Mycena leptocephala]
MWGRWCRNSISSGTPPCSIILWWRAPRYVAEMATFLRMDEFVGTNELYESRLSPALVRACRGAERDTWRCICSTSTSRPHATSCIRGWALLGLYDEGEHEHHGTSPHIPATAPPATGARTRLPGPLASVRRTTAMAILIPTTSYERAEGG